MEVPKKLVKRNTAVGLKELISRNSRSSLFGENKKGIFNITIVGESGVGKSALMVRLLTGSIFLKICYKISRSLYRRIRGHPNYWSKDKSDKQQRSFSTVHWPRQRKLARKFWRINRQIRRDYTRLWSCMSKFSLYRGNSFYENQIWAREEFKKLFDISCWQQIGLAYDRRASACFGKF